MVFIIPTTTGFTSHGLLVGRSCRFSNFRKLRNTPSVPNSKSFPPSEWRICGLASPFDLGFQNNGFLYRTDFFLGKRDDLQGSWKITHFFGGIKQCKSKSILRDLPGNSGVVTALFGLVLFGPLLEPDIWWQLWVLNQFETSVELLTSEVSGKAPEILDGDNDSRQKPMRHRNTHFQRVQKSTWFWFQTFVLVREIMRNS